MTRIGNPARLFFAPVEPFLIDDAADHKRAGRLARVSLEPIWGWIGRDLIPAEAKALSEDINRALLDGSDQGRTADPRPAQSRAPAHQGSALLRDRRRQGPPAPRRASGHATGARRPGDADPQSRPTATCLNDLARRLPNHLRSFERERSTGQSGSRCRHDAEGAGRSARREDRRFSTGSC